MKAAVLLVALGACMGDNSSPPVGGPTRTFVISRELVPRNNTEARDLAVDVDHDDRVDQLGMVVGTLAGQLQNDFLPQAITDAQIDRGGFVQLVTLQTPGPDDDGTIAGISLQTGTNPDPSPCLDDADATCRRHLDGTASFELAGLQPPLPRCQDDEQVLFGPGQLQIVVSFFGTPAVVDLHGARITVANPDAEHLTGIIAGAIPVAQVVHVLVPQWPALLNRRIERDCTALASPPLCGCGNYTLGKTMVSVFDTTHDCTISTDEILENNLITSLLRPDIDNKFLSIGFGFEAVPAQLR